MADIIINEDLLRRIVRAIDKAIADDIPQYLRDHRKETNNAIMQLRGDYINENLRQFVIAEGIELIPFRRFVWQGRLLADRRNKVTYSITTQANLSAIPKKKDRTKPHFLQSVLAAENSGYQGRYKQETLFSMDMFDAETLKNDYDEIIAGMLNPAEGYCHYVISYQTAENDLVDVKLEFLDCGFATVEEVSLNDYIKPDFARLTNTESIDENVPIPASEGIRGLLGIKKAGIRPALREAEEEA